MVIEKKSSINEAIIEFDRLTSSTKILFEKIINERGVDVLSVSGRTKSISSINDKIKRKLYSDPLIQMTDITGLRVVVFFESHISEVSDIIREVFNVDEENSIDRDQLLGGDRIGYRSVHFVCSLGGQRKELPEYASIHDLKFEIQIRTVLQHAWAELAHDRAYKFSGSLPSYLQRKLNLYSGMLEIVDKGFDEVAREVDQYYEVLEIDSSSSFDDREIDSIVVSKFMSKIIEGNDLEVDNVEIDKEMVNELISFGVSKVHDLYDICNRTFIDSYLERSFGYQNTYGFLRDAMMYYDIDRYFNQSWPVSRWSGTTEESIRLLSEKYGVTVRSHFVSRDMDILEEDEYLVI